MKGDALFDERDGKTGGMRSLVRAGPDGLIGNEPSIAAAALIRAAGVLPALDVGFVRVGNSGGPTIKPN